MENEMQVKEAIEKINASIEEKTQGFVKSEDLEALKNELATLKDAAEKGHGVKSEDLDAVKTAVAAIEGKLDALKEEPKRTTNRFKSLGAAIVDAFKASAEAIAGLASKTDGTVKLDVKAAGTMTINGNYSGGTVGLSQMEEGLTRIQRRQPFMRSLVNSRGTAQTKFVVYTEQKNPDPGVAGMTAEGADKTQTDFDIVETSKQVKKVTAYIKVSKEMLADVPFMEGEINGELIEIIELKLDEQILLGDGTGDNLEGIDLNAVAFVPGSFAAAVPQANNTDVLRVAIAQIANNNFMANYILLNPEDAAQMDLTKDANGQYTYMAVITMDGVTRVKNVPVIENPGVPVGQYYVGDFTKSNLRIRENINVQVGYVNDDFTKNLVTILAEMRAVHYVKSNHYGAFVKGTFAADIAAIDKP